MRRELDERIELTSEQITLLDNHSILNQFNILEQQLALLNSRIHDPRITGFLKFCLDVLIELPNGGILPIIPRVEESYSRLEEFIEEISESNQEEDTLITGLRETITIGRTRLREMMIDRHIWKETAVEDFHSTLKSFLKASELVSGGRFKIDISSELPEDSSYHIDMEFDFPNGRVTAPAILNDLIRDLVANSRKYSEPGTRILLQLRQAEQQGLILKVADEGLGIPEDEIDKVVHYGYRATNVMDRRTMGGGFGLTKAFQFCKQSKGRFFIESERDKGTTIELSLYPPH